MAKNEPSLHPPFAGYRPPAGENPLSNINSLFERLAGTTAADSITAALASGRLRPTPLPAVPKATPYGDVGRGLREFLGGQS